MARKLRIAAVCTIVVTTLVVALLGGAYYAARQVRPFYQEALQVKPEVLERGSQELESRATALYSDAKQIGHWQALFTVEQINGWLATQLAADKGLPSNMHEPRVAIARDMLTLGFRTKSGGVETVVSVDASVLLTKDGDVGVRLMSVKAGALPLPVMQLAEELATACKKLKLPVKWRQQDGRPIAIVSVANASMANRDFFIDSIELRKGEMYVAGHTEKSNVASKDSHKLAKAASKDASDFTLDDYELRLTPDDEHSAFEIARRPDDARSDEIESTKR
jgi:hypothetical protein